MSYHIGMAWHERKSVAVIHSCTHSMKRGAQHECWPPSSASAHHFPSLPSQGGSQLWILWNTSKIPGLPQRLTCGYRYISLVVARQSTLLSPMNIYCHSVFVQRTQHILLWMSNKWAHGSNYAHRNIYAQYNKQKHCRMWGCLQETVCVSTFTLLRCSNSV